VVLAKIVATGFTLGSGGSGGLLFPALFLGGVTGAAYSKLLRAFTAAGWVPGIMVMSPNERAGMILVGMGGVFAACTKTPIASLVMVSEITGSYGLSVPLMMTCASAYLLSHSFTMNEEQVPGIADSPAHRGEFLVNVLQDLKVSDALPKTVPIDTIPEDTPYLQVLEKIRASSATVFPIVDENSGLVGLFSMNDLRQIMHEQSVSRLLVAGDLASADFAVVHMDTTLDAALRIFTQRNVEALPVVEGIATDVDVKKAVTVTARRKVIGLLSRRDLISTYHQKLHDIQSAAPAETNESHVFVDALSMEEAPTEAERPRTKEPL
jgi:CIC family chloride channel protein